MDLSTNLLTALNAYLVQSTPQCSPNFKRKVIEAKGTITFQNGNTQELFSSKFSSNDIKIILDTDNFDINEINETLYFTTKKNNIKFKCNKILFN